MSFAELLETGTSAGAVSGSRALGFSEAGIMGLHFAMGESGVAGDAKDGPIGSGCDHAGTALADRADALADGRLATTPIRGAGIAAAADANFRPIPNHEAALCQQPSSLQGESVGITGQALREECDGDEGPARIMSRLATQPRTGAEGNSRIRLNLTENGGNISVMVEGIGHDDESRREFERIAREVAGEFGVTISGLVITSASSIDTVTKMGRRL